MLRVESRAIELNTSSGWQRFNVLGALNAVTTMVITVCHTTLVNQDTFCELLDRSAVLQNVGQITLMLDNASDQHCAPRERGPIADSAAVPRRDRAHWHQSFGDVGNRLWGGDSHDFES